MKTTSWFQCGQTPVSTDDALVGLRARLWQLYTSGNPREYSLVVAAVAPETEGFDRLTIRLSYTRILGELTADPALLAGTGLAVALIFRDDNLSANLARLRMRLDRVTTVGGPPHLWLQRLPPDFSMALDLLDELSELRTTHHYYGRVDSHTQLPVVGMVGGGQLARMTHQAAISLGQSLRVLAASADDGAAIVAAGVQVGAHTDLEALRRFAKDCDVLTFDHEHVPGEALHALASEGVVVRPGPNALKYAQDKQAMRRRLSDAGMPVPRWAPIDSADALARFGVPCVVKTATGGYDGNGVFYIDAPDEIAPLLEAGAVLIAEERVRLRRELAALVARSPGGEIAAYPIAETVQRDGICTEVIAPAPGLSEARASDIATRIASELDVTGLLAVELFETGDGLVVNELAMRPHNSGHWTIEGTRTSQFEQHLRAVLDYPLGETAATAPVTVMANVLGGAPGGARLDERLQALLAEDPGARVHLYGKQVRPGRKIGHVTVLGDDVESVRRRAKRAASWLRHGDPQTGEDA